MYYQKFNKAHNPFLRLNSEQNPLDKIKELVLINNFLNKTVTCLLMILEILIENGFINHIENLFSFDHKRLLHLGGTQGDVYQFTQDNTDYILKISPIQLSYIEPLRGQAEFANYLADNGVNVSEYIPSVEGNYVEIIKSGSTLLGISKFIKSRG